MLRHVGVWMLTKGCFGEVVFLMSLIEICVDEKWPVIPNSTIVFNLATNSVPEVFCPTPIYVHLIALRLHKGPTLN
jgi:hypothetical protein